jgi:hypothetical protein
VSEQETADSAKKQLNGYNLDARLDLDHTAGSKHQKRAELSRQKLSA